MGNESEYLYVTLYYKGQAQFRPWLLVALIDGRKQSVAELTVSPDWEEWTSEGDHAYLTALLHDFTEDCSSDPDGLILRATGLSIGILRTGQSGKCDFASLEGMRRKVLLGNLEPPISWRDEPRA